MKNIELRISLEHLRKKVKKEYGISLDNVKEFEVVIDMNGSIHTKIIGSDNIEEGKMLTLLLLEEIMKMFGASEEEIEKELKYVEKNFKVNI